MRSIATFAAVLTHVTALSSLGLVACAGGSNDGANAGGDPSSPSSPAPPGSNDSGVTNDAGGKPTEAGTTSDSGRSHADAGGDTSTVPAGYRCSRPPATPGAPELPRVSIDTTYPTLTGAKVHLHAGDDLQKAIDAASPGDTILLAAGATFAPVHLPRKSGDGWIVVRTETDDASLPPGVRVSPADASKMARIVTTTVEPAIKADDGAHHYRFVGVEIAASDGVSVYQMVQLDAVSADPSAFPHDLVFDRTYVHGDPKTGGKRGFQLNGGATAIIDSFVTDFKREGQDAQAIGGWEGPGPYRIVNNQLEGAAENVLFGGADGRFPDVVPSDIEICHNHIVKPARWKRDAPTFEGTSWSVKNLIELKEGRRVLIADNELEQSWAMAQVGYAMVLWSVNQDGGAPWNQTADITIVHNLIHDVGAGINLSRGNENPNVPAARFWIDEDLFYDVGTKAFDGDERLFQILGGVDDVWITHVTGGAPNTYLSQDGTLASHGFIFRDSIVEHGEYGIHGSGLGDGTSTLDAVFPGYSFDHDVVVGGPASAYPATANSFPADDAATGFVDAAAHDFHLTASSPFKGKASDGSDPGADVDAVMKAIE